MSVSVSLIVAASENGVIGIENRLPWSIPEDLKRFRAITSGHPVIMGRKTFQSIGRPLPNRKNIVISRDPAFQAPGVLPASSLEEALDLAREGAPREIFVIGGAEIYRLALPIANRLYLTVVHQEIHGDAFFPEWNQLHSIWTEVSREEYRDHSPAFSFVNLER